MRASRSAMQGCATHLYRPLRSLTQIRGLHFRRSEASQRPRAADRRPSARRVGPSEGSPSCAAPLLHPAAAAGLAKTALQESPKTAFSPLFSLQSMRLRQNLFRMELRV